MKKEKIIDPFLGNKILYHPERIADFLRMGSTKPITWEFDLTNQCNHHCPGCSGGKINTESLSLQTAKDYIDQIRDFNAKAITLTGGGEPLLNSIYPQIIEYIKFKNLDVALITNGSLITQQNASIILKNCTWIRISLDAGSPEVFRKTHGCNKNMFNQIIEGISLLSELKKREYSNCTIGIAFLTNKETQPDMLKFTKLCKSLGIDYVQFRPFHYNTTDISENLMKCKKEETSVFKVLWSRNKYKHFHQSRPYAKCFGHHFAGVINIHSLYLCCHFRGMPKYKLGDLRKNSLKEIWYSKKRKKIYENINYSDCVPACRCDPFNRILWQLGEKTSTHINFL